MEEQNKILLVDGHSILNRAFYALPLLTNAEGLHTNAVYGFLNMLFSIVREENPDLLAVAFDLPAPTFRHQLFAEYKGTRSAMPEELKEQVPLIKEVLQAMEVRIFSLEGYEADDIIGTLAKKCQDAGMEAVIFSGDRDLLQLADKSIRIRLPRTAKGKTTILNFTPESIEETYHLKPSQIVDSKALMGDASDNIPGLPGVGEKTAQKILNQFQTLEEAHAHLEEITPKRARESMRDHYDRALLSQKLARINTRIPLDFSFEELKRKDFHTEEAFRLFKKLNFRNLLTEFEEQKKERDVAVLRPASGEELERLLKEALQADRIGLFFLGEADRITGSETILGLSIAYDEGKVLYLTEKAQGREKLLHVLERILTSGVRVCLFGLKEVLHFVPVDARKDLYDPEIAAYLLDPLPSSYPYDQILKKYTGRTMEGMEEIFHRKKLPKISEMKDEEAESYAVNLALSSYLLLPSLLDELKKNEMLALYEDLEMPLVFTLADMEETGIALQKDVLRKISTQLADKIREEEERIYARAGHAFNINSPKQLGNILFEELGLPGGKKTKTGYSTAADVLEKLAPFEPMVQDILEYRQLTKLKSTYADALEGYVAADGRIHSHFNQTITATGRISSSDPNLQNIPIRMEMGRRIRQAFVPREGYIFLDADYSQIELRMLAHMSGDEKLLEAYREEKDIHTITASQVFHIPPEEVTRQQRRNAKAVNFGIIYGISSFGLSQGLSISRREAEGYMEQYFSAYPKIKSFLDQLVEDARKKGYSETIFNRRRPVPELKEKNFMRRQFGERVAMNAPIQGSAADLIKIAMNRVHERLKKENLRSKLVLQVHDELILEVAKEEEKQVSALLKEEMTGAASLKVALEIEMSTGENWYEAK